MTKPLIVITGASSGIGAATAQAFAELDHPLLLLARRLDRLEDLKLPNALCRTVDVTDAQAVADAVTEAEYQHGPTDAIVNNAGVMLLGHIAAQAPAEWRTMFDVNVLGLLNGVHAVLPGMIERGRGTVINVSSVAGRKGFPNHAVYGGTKFAVHAMSESLREEVAGKGVRVTTIAPGAVETELLSHTTDEAIKADYQAWKEANDVLTAEDVAAVIQFTYEQPQRVCVREVVLAATAQQA
ncbi:SDR family oxidoreductase [Allokutzneria albata]|uniref:NADP-dependent 3-hydroxy acid dehydrogenase YdfG n=1 Tax=Allokutzneria albata TaxID=211114 RepID=A0A1H0CNP0_ALLAB|nr:SDR family oxidoreductase [Allokutzneria albata]SDN59463.1 NADP-dependent 3-hydroxy acid dehydrogenase YdfG [Allokutzneria albata]